MWNGHAHNARLMLSNAFCNSIQGQDNEIDSIMSCRLIARPQGIFPWPFFIFGMVLTKKRQRWFPLFLCLFYFVLHFPPPRRKCGLIRKSVAIHHLACHAVAVVRMLTRREPTPSKANLHPHLPHASPFPVFLWGDEHHLSAPFILTPPPPPSSSSPTSRWHL